MAKENNTFGSFIKVLIGIGLAVLIFMSYMLAEQQGWVNTDIASRILRGVEDGKAMREEAEKRQAEKQEAAANEQKTTAPAAQNTQPEPSPKQAEPAKSEEPANTDDSASDDDFGDDDSSDTSSDSDDSSSDDSASDDSASDDSAGEEPKAAPAETSSKPKKLDFSEIARKRSTWPKAVHVRVKGTKIPLLDRYGNAIGQVELPIGTRLFVRKVSSTGILEVKSASNGQVFQLHHSRTTFRKLYTGKPISDGLVATSSSSSSASSSNESSDDSSDDSDSDDSSSDDFGDDDFFDDDF